MKIHSAWKSLITVAVLLQHQSTALAEPFTEKLFFNDKVPSAQSQTVQAGEDVVLECEAAGRPSPTIYWQYKGRRLNPVNHTLVTYNNCRIFARTCTWFLIWFNLGIYLENLICYCISTIFLHRSFSVTESKHQPLEFTKAHHKISRRRKVGVALG